MASTLGIDTLFRTGLPSNDPTALPSCTGRTDMALGGMQVPDDDPTQPYRYWWDPAGAGSYLVWDGSALTTVTVPNSKTPNLPGIETFPPYAVPVTNSTWVQVPGFPANTFPSSWLSQYADAVALLASFPNATLETGQQCFPAAVFNIDPAYAATWQPWVMILPDGVTKTFAGGLIQQMYGPNSINGGGRGNPGAWIANGWVPTPPPSGQSSTTLGPPCNPVPAGYQLQRVQNGITFIWELVPVTGTTATIVVNSTIGPGTYTVTPQ